MPQSTNLTVGQGETFKILVSITDQTNTPLDITLRQFSGSVRETYSSEDSSADFDFEKISPNSSGSLYVSLVPASSSLLTAADYVYDVIMVSGSGATAESRRIIEGKFTVRPSVTR